MIAVPAPFTDLDAVIGGRRLEQLGAEVGDAGEDAGPVLAYLVATRERSTGCAGWSLR